MVTVSHMVEELVGQKPFLEDFLSRGLVNYAALAEDLKPEIEKSLKKEVKNAAIMMSLRRLTRKLEKHPSQGPNIKFTDSNIMVKSDLFEITVLKSSTLIPQLRKLYDLVDYNKGDFLTVTHGIYEVTIISNKKHKEKIEKIFEDEHISGTIEGIASLSIKIPEELIGTVGMFYVITKALNWENINITEIVSTMTELTFILSEEDVPSAFDTIKELIKE